MLLSRRYSPLPCLIHSLHDLCDGCGFVLQIHVDLFYFQLVDLHFASAFDTSITDVLCAQQHVLTETFVQQHQLITSQVGVLNASSKASIVKINATASAEALIKVVRASVSARVNLVHMETQVYE